MRLASPIIMGTVVLWAGSGLFAGSTPSPVPVRELVSRDRLFVWERCIRRSPRVATIGYKFDAALPAKALPDVNRDPSGLAPEELPTEP